MKKKIRDHNFEQIHHNTCVTKYALNDFGTYPKQLPSPEKG
jgi:hypothetical protein